MAQTAVPGSLRAVQPYISRQYHLRRRRLPVRHATLHLRRRPLTRLSRTRLRIRPLVAHSLTDFDAVVSEREDANGIEQNSDGSYHPSAYRLPPGRLGGVNRSGSARPEDAYHEHEDGSRSWRTEDNGYLVKILSSHVYDVAIASPLEKASKLSQQTGNEILLKREDLQPVFSFKLRGAYNLMRHLSKKQLKKGVVCSSAGNHAQGVALAASKLGCDALICMPTSTPSIKIDAVKRLGSTVRLIGESYQETQDYAINLSKEEGRILVPPFDDPYTIAGQGTIGKEILDAVQSGQKLDAVFVSIGGGGLIAGIAAYIKAVRPEIKVIGVEPSDANAMAISLHQGYRIRLSQVDTFADGVAVKQVGKETFRMCRRLVDGVVMVDNSACSAAIKDVYDETRSILEPAGALALAGAKAYLSHYDIKGSTVVAVCSGANINFNSLRLVSELADVGARREFMLATTIPETAGTFRRFVETALTGTHLYVTEFRYRYAAGNDAHIMWGVGSHGQEDIDALIARLNDKGYPTMDISQVEEMQSLLSNFVGGRPRSYMGAVPDERVLKVMFPERQGALQSFLEVVSPRWNLTMFCYRNIGTEATSVMIGIQLPPDEEEEFMEAVGGLNGFMVQPISEIGQRLYKMFLQ